MFDQLARVRNDDARLAEFEEVLRRQPANVTARQQIQALRK